MEQTKNAPPIKHIKCAGVRVSVWCDKRTGQDGRGFESFSVTLDRAYKDANGAWQNTGRLRENDIPKAIVALGKAFEFVTMRDNEEATAGPVTAK